MGFSLTVTEKWSGLTLEAVLRDELAFSKKTIHQWRMEKGIHINGELVPWKNTLSEGDTLTFSLDDPAPSYPPFQMPVDILFEDDHLIIVNKPAQMDTHPNEPGQNNTLVNAVVHHELQSGRNGYIQPIHRLDRDTTGAILFAKHSAIKPLLDQMLEKRDIQRTYLAIVQGEVKTPKGTINQPIGKDRHHATRRRVSPGGQKAVTHYRKVRFDASSNTTIMELSLDTGRTHQIRVHLSSIGHPIVGDTLYGAKKAGHSYQALHAARLSFIHPFTGEHIKVEASDPLHRLA
ncbi:RluA family pseudouridine synthase [Jeotgalibacillus sp. R-1-5s-1]|uniref:RluA family pseudouridine synthase n=1 Tax=Jeotgalibacillus sp. R-1-5s-1 TaxID=2555897 RepID=UPI00106C2A6E|nr:RluA family pseudouridine synthase [Jeotgalibacillus sp. R-1-5s-1]TFD91893.1 RluA family pseudouridine synthase [Jeotgalibacillus sp. R-1-5s-1]